MQKNQREIKRIHEEIKEDYAFAVKKSVVDFVLKEPEIDEDERFRLKLKKNSKLKTSIT